jgi:hypothetical protein
MFSSIHSFAPLLPGFFGWGGVFGCGEDLRNLPLEIFYFTTLAEDLEDRKRKGQAG